MRTTRVLRVLQGKAGMAALVRGRTGAPGVLRVEVLEVHRPR